LSIREKTFIHIGRISGSTDCIWPRAQKYEFDISLVGPMYHETMHVNPALTLKIVFQQSSDRIRENVDELQPHLGIGPKAEILQEQSGVQTLVPGRLFGREAIEKCKVEEIGRARVRHRYGVALREADESALRIELQPILPFGNFRTILAIHHPC